MWFLLSLLAGLLFAANKIIVRSSLSKKINPLAFGAIHELIAGVLLLPFALFHVSWPHTIENWIALCIGIFFIFLADITAFFALKYIEASIYQIVGQLRHVVVLFGAFLLFAEPIAITKVISIIFIIIGVGIALLDKAKIEINKGTIYSFLSTLSIAIAFLFIKKTAVDVNPSFLASISLLISGFLTYLVYLYTNHSHTVSIKMSSYKPLLIAAITFAVFEFTTFTALAVGEASKVTPVIQSSMIFTLIGGYIFLHEETRLKKKIIGSILIILGIGMLYFV